MALDMRDTVAPKSNQLNADDLIGRTLTIKITGVKGTDNAEQPVSIHYEGDNGKPYMPCKGMRRVMIHVWTHQTSEYIGRSMTLYCDPKVKFGGMEVGGIRISHMSHIDKPVTMALTASKANKKPFIVQPLKVAETPKIVLDAKAAAERGSEEYKKFLAALTPEQKEPVKPFHRQYQDIAIAFDERNSDVPDGMDDI